VPSRSLHRTDSRHDRTRASLERDAKAERVTSNAAANKMLSYEYREPYTFPV